MREYFGDINLLVIEDNPADVFLLKKMLQRTSLSITNIHEAGNLEEGLNSLQKFDIHLALLDLSLPDSSGLDSLVAFRKATEKIPVIILTGLNDGAIGLKSIMEGAQDYLVKGEFNISGLEKAIQYSIERKRQEEKIKESEEKYRQTFQNSPFPCWIYDSENLQIMDVNMAAIEKYGYSREEFVRLTLEDIQERQDIFVTAKMPGEAGSGAKNLRHRKKDGEMITVEATFYPVSYFDKNAMQTQINDVSEKKQLESQLASQEKLRRHQLTKAALIAEERERKYIGEELHDNINQVLATVKLYLDLCIEGHERKDELIEKSSKNVQIVIEEIRKLSRNLISPDQETGSLSELLSDLVKEIAVATSIHFNIDIKKIDEDKIEKDLKIAMYRIAQEQLNNILKYAGAKSVQILAYSEEDKLTLAIRDDGKGFELSTAKTGIGIINMTHRAEAFNGKLEIETSPGEGCELRVVFNLKLTPS